VALAECCVGNQGRMLGAEVDLSGITNIPDRAVLFGEAQGRAIVSTSQVAEVMALAHGANVPARVIGEVHAEGGAFVIRTAHSTLVTTLEALRAAYHDSSPRIMERPVAALAHSAGGEGE